MKLTRGVSAARGKPCVIGWQGNEHAEVLDAWRDNKECAAPGTVANTGEARSRLSDNTLRLTSEERLVGSRMPADLI